VQEQSDPPKQNPVAESGKDALVHRRFAERREGTVLRRPLRAAPSPPAGERGLPGVTEGGGLPGRMRIAPVARGRP
jgi:hypothetical protein